MRPLGPKRELPLRRRQGPRPVVVAWGIGALVAAVAGVKAGPAAGAAVARVARGEAFALRVVSVAGAARVTPQEIAAAAGVGPGAPLFDVDAEAVAQRVAELPAIASARAVRLPPHRLVIGVVERAPAGVVEAGAPGALHLVCGEGVPFAAAALEEAARLPRLRIAAPVVPGEPQPALHQAAALAAALSHNGLAPEEVTLGGPGDPEGAVVRLRGLSTRIVLGEHPYTNAITRLVQFLGRRPELALASLGVDLRWTNRAVLRGASGPGEEVGLEASPPREGAAAVDEQRAG